MEKNVLIRNQEDVNDVKTMHFIYVIIKDALEDLDG